MNKGEKAPFQTVLNEFFKGKSNSLPLDIGSQDPTYFDSPYDKWTDEYCLNEYRHTGNPKFLTPELAHQIKLLPEDMAQVPEVNDSDIKKAEQYAEKDKELDDFLRKDVLVRAGVDPDKFYTDIGYHLDVRSSLGSFSDKTLNIDDYDMVVDQEFLEDWCMRDPEEFIEAIFTRLDFTNVEGFSKQGNILAFARNFFINLLHKEQDELDFYNPDFTSHTASEEDFSKITTASRLFMNLARAKIAEASGNYLLNVRLQEIVQQLSKGVLEYEEYNATPFQIAPNMYAGFSEDGERIFIAPREHNYMIDRYINASGSEDNHDHYDIFYSRIVDAGDVLTPALIGLPHIESDDFRDFIFLHSEYMKELVESDFGFSMADISLKEQFYFLNYLKHTTVAGAGAMKQFIRNFGLDGLRSFLVNEKDGQASENITIFGILIEPEAAKEVFASYTKAIDSSVAFAKAVGKQVENEKTKQILTEFQAAMLERAADLFRAGKQMALWEYAGVEQTVDLIQAAAGYAKIQETLAGLESDQYRVEAVELPEKEVLRNTEAGFSVFKFKVTDSLYEVTELKVTIRPETSAQGQARINFELDLSQLPSDSKLKKAFTQIIDQKPRPGFNAKHTEKSVIRIGFDLDTKISPPVFSFDMGRHRYHGEHMTRTGDVLGNILEQVAPEGHNLTNFSQEFSNPETFSQVADSFKEYFERLSLGAAEPDYRF